MNIPHLTHPDRSRFYPLIRQSLHRTEQSFPVTVLLGKPGGYGGTIEVTIQSPDEVEFEAALVLTDWTRFPARIRAAATALRDSDRFGAFRISHVNGTLSIANGNL